MNISKEKVNKYEAFWWLFSSDTKKKFFRSINEANRYFVYSYPNLSNISSNRPGVFLILHAHGMIAITKNGNRLLVEIRIKKNPARLDGNRLK
jgi:hypothetical protein